MQALFRRRRVLTWSLIVILACGAWLGWRMKGPHRWYAIDEVNVGANQVETPGRLEVGVAKRDITPDLELYDLFEDVSGSNSYEPHKGDVYVDRTGSGRFDPVWLGGFSYNRPATDVNDPLWARAIAFRNNGVTLVMVTIDSVGIFYDRFIGVRKAIDPALDIDHVMFSSTHTHAAPDTMGLWSYQYVRNRLDPRYMRLLHDACVEAVEEAVRNLEPAEAYYTQVDIDPEGFVRDTRQPIVYDEILGLMRFTRPDSDETIATVMSWGNHPEALDGSNTVITSDFSHYWREGVENGVPDPNGAEGLGGMALYFQGNLGGLMTPLGLEVPHRSGEYSVTENSFQKARYLGENLAIKTVNALRGDNVRKMEDTRIAYAAETIYIPVENAHFRIAMMLGVLHPGWYWGKGRSEINALRVGEVEWLTIPGELYPEIGDGGVESPEGADFPGEPIEVPPLRSQMRGEMNLMVNLANDAIGYIIPKTQWDVDPPHAYGRDRPQYGEVNSVGPNIAPVLHEKSLALLERLHAALEGAG